jgi:hypothetical protein
MAQVTIKGLRLFGGVITWCYDNPQQARGPWKHITDTGRTHDSDERLIQALYFLGDSTAFSKHWSEPVPKHPDADYRG